ncbi:hypothetical protein AA0311_0624 [Asaia bogorensis NBRC 16594]|uniref:Uncharacterized protein n=1 Tax=Asaia bogorensis NBRC 16594 TaxID=1231624 RepID=A0AAN4U1R2_9PROT|nr:hypothetical protein AA0311_0624 [Asaia bogorensis NBRC 16594]GEL52766.1 hypothetical protein ABO01nite_07730 [Asaia bogorensis NBRC 16594]
MQGRIEILAADHRVQSLRIHHIDLMKRHTRWHGRQMACAEIIDNNDLVPGIQQAQHGMAAYKPSPAGYEVTHLSLLHSALARLACIRRV